MRDNAPVIPLGLIDCETARDLRTRQVNAPGIDNAQSSAIPITAYPLDREGLDLYGSFNGAECGEWIARSAEASFATVPRKLGSVDTEQPYSFRVAAQRVAIYGLAHGERR